MNDSEQKPDDATTTPYSPEPYVHPLSDDPLTPPAAADAVGEVFLLGNIA